MATLIKVDTAAEAIVDAYHMIKFHGSEVTVRGMKTKELEDVTFEFSSPHFCWTYGLRKSMKHAIGVAEAMQLIGAFSDPMRMCEIAPNMKAFLDGGIFKGAYGIRAGAQIDKIIELLKNDPETRQAVITLRDPYRDLFEKSKDVPCTIAMSFRIRNGKLNMTTHMRSNDLVWGFPYDVIQFCLLQMTIAEELGIENGTYTHHADSLHIYERHAKMMQECVSKFNEENAPQPKLYGLSSRAFAADIFYCDDTHIDKMTMFEKFLFNTIKAVFSQSQSPSEHADTAA